MLIGSTYAWFTDSVTSGRNKITAGNLDLEVEYTNDGENWQPLEEGSDVFGNGLFEPGYTRVAAFRTKNVGTLALKYQMSIDILDETPGVNVYGDEFKLSDHLTLRALLQQANYIGDIALSYAFSERKNSLAYEEQQLGELITSHDYRDGNCQLLPGEDGNQYLIVEIAMPETVGNEANYREENIPQIDFSVRFSATQFPYESDSFDSQYDKDAKYPITTDKDLQKALAKGGDIALSADIEDAATVRIGSSTTLDLNEKKLSSMMVDTANAGNVEISNGTINQLPKDETINLTYPFAFTVWEGSDVTLKNVVINATSENDPTGHNNNAVNVDMGGVLKLESGTVINGNIFVQPTGKLFIQDGVTVNFAPAGSTGAWWGDVEITGGRFSIDVTSRVDTEKYNVEKDADGYYAVTAK